MVSTLCEHDNNLIVEDKTQLYYNFHSDKVRYRMVDIVRIVVSGEQLLIWSFLPMPIKESLHNIPDPAMLQMCPKNDEDPPVGCSKPVLVLEEKRNPNDFCPSSVLKSTKESSLTTVSETCVPNLVYKRKNRCGPESIDVRRTGDCNSTIFSDCPSIAKHEASGEPIMPSLELNPKPTSGCASSQDHRPNENPMQAHKIIDMDSVYDSCSSRSNAEPVSVPLKTRTEESGECSTSSLIAIEAREATLLSERDICISVLQNAGLLVKSSTSCTEAGNKIGRVDSYGSRECKVCGLSGTTRKMLICDSCDEAFHLSCCNARTRSFRDNDEWSCASCMTKKHTLIRQTDNMGKLTKIDFEVDRSRSRPAAEKLSPIYLMLRDTGPYQTNVGVGKCFQANVPDWTGPVEGDDRFGEPEELDTSAQSHLHGYDSSRSPRLSSIGNWLQCKQVIDHGKGTICGKWRRAPLFEVQTNEWECFCSVFWDPSHADCAAPQEVNTDEVLKQLKYMETLRPRLASKRRKLVRPDYSQQVKGTRKNT